MNRLSGKRFYIDFNLLLIKECKQKAWDMVISIDFDTAYAGRKISKYSHCKWVIDAHEWFSELPEVINRRFTRYLWLKIEEKYTPLCDGLISVSNGLLDYYTQLGQTNTLLLHNFPNYTEWVERPIEPAVVYKGVLNMGRGLETLIEIAPQLKAPVYIIGDGDIRQKLEKLAENSSNVHFKGALYGPEADAILKKASVGYNVLENLGKSYFYSLANKFFDYTMMGLPSVLPPFPEYYLKLEEFPVGEVASINNKARLIQLINSMLDNSLQYRIVCKEASKEWNWEKQEAALLHFIQSTFEKESEYTPRKSARKSQKSS